MKPSLLIPLLVVVVAFTLAGACDKDESDEDAIRNVILDYGAALTDRDFDKLAQLVVADACGVDEVTAESLRSSPGCGSPPTFEKFEVKSIVIVGTVATARISVTVDGLSEQRAIGLLKVAGRWLVRSGG